MPNNGYYPKGSGNTMPGYTKDKHEMQAEIRKLWMRFANFKVPVIPPQEKAWSWSGIVAPSEATEGQHWQAPANMTLVSMVLTLAVPASITYGVYVMHDGAIAGGGSILAGSTQGFASIQRNVGKGEFVYPLIGQYLAGDGEMLGIVVRWEAISQ